MIEKSCVNCYYAHVNCEDKSIACDIEERVCDNYMGIIKIENALLDRVLEIIDKHGEQLVKSIVDGSYPEIKAADILASVREDVEALKGGEL